MILKSIAAHCSIVFCLLFFFGFIVYMITLLVSSSFRKKSSKKSIQKIVHLPIDNIKGHQIDYLQGILAGECSKHLYYVHHEMIQGPKSLIIKKNDDLYNVIIPLQNSIHCMRNKKAIINNGQGLIVYKKKMHVFIPNNVECVLIKFTHNLMDL